MDITNLIPKHKLDIETAEKLMGKSYEQVKPIVPELMEWIQDMNWPVAKKVAEYLVTISDNLTSHILDILNGEDEEWKYWCIGVFYIYSDETKHLKVRKVLERIAKHPTDTEKESEVHFQAIRALQNK